MHHIRSTVGLTWNPVNVPKTAKLYCASAFNVNGWNMSISVTVQCIAITVVAAEFATLAMMKSTKGLMITGSGDKRETDIMMTMLKAVIFCRA